MQSVRITLGFPGTAAVSEGADVDARVRTHTHTPVHRERNLNGKVLLMALLVTLSLLPLSRKGESFVKTHS